MDQEFWHGKWEANEIGFHQDEVHPLLLRHWPSMQLHENEKVFVPLCGKSRDLIWLMQNGYQVSGIELSDIAVKSFFDENDLSSSVETIGALESYTTEHMQIYAGDFFSLTKQMLGQVVAVYDRAALIALPPEMRLYYVKHLQGLLSTGTKILLITLEYEPGLIEPPPFSVSQDDIEDLYGSWCDIQLLEAVTAEVKGKTCREIIYHLTCLT